MGTLSYPRVNEALEEYRVEWHPTTGSSQTTELLQEHMTNTQGPKDTITSREPTKVIPGWGGGTGAKENRDSKREVQRTKEVLL